MVRYLLVLPVVLAGCAGPPPEAPHRETVKSNTPDAGSTKKQNEGVEADAAAADAEPVEAAPAYVEPPAQVVHRYHVFGTMKARAAKKVVMTSVLTTASDDSTPLAPGMEALLEFKAKGAKEWVPVADVTVKKLTTKGSKVRGDERQEIELEMTAQHPAAMSKGIKNPFRPRARVRLQVDRPEPAP